jgi:hypothetical protein
VKDEFKKDVKAVGHSQDDTETQAQADVHTPVEERQNNQVKLFGAEGTEEPRRSDEPGSAGLQPGDEIYAPVKDRIHGNNKNSFLG